MTRQRSLKQIIRARAAKTGERYTTARRHVLRDHAPAREAGTPAPHVPATAAVVPPPDTSDARIVEKTGHGLAHWFAVLDAFGATERGHTAAARHLATAHGIPGWHAQSITVSYERARGLRAANQRMSGEYQVSISRTIAASSEEIARAFKRAHAPRGSKPFSLRENGRGRLRYKDGTSTVEVMLTPNGRGKVVTVVTCAGLASAAQVEERRVYWRAALNALGRTKGTGRTKSTKSTKSTKGTKGTKGFGPNSA